jgi:hypothetical protein
MSVYDSLILAMRYRDRENDQNVFLAFARAATVNRERQRRAVNEL